MIIERWHPVTHDMGLINAPVEEVVSALLQWHASIGVTYTRKEISASFAAALDALPPLSMEKRRRLFVGTQANWTACFQSGIDGSDPFPAMSYLAEQLRVLAMRVCSTPPGATWTGNIWEVYGPENLGGTPPLGYRRSISAMNDGGSWGFEESGSRFPFEKPEFYELRRKRDRFTRELLINYLAHFGLAPFDDGFYIVSATFPAVLLENTVRWKHKVPQFSLEQVVAGVPWNQNKVG